jgi:hypothetical protein
MLEAMVEALAIGIFADEAMQRRLQRATTRQISVLNTLTELERFAKGQSRAVLFVDPLLIPAEYRRDTLRQLLAPRRIETVAYARLTHHAAPVLLEMGRMGFRHCLLFGADDDVADIHAALAQAVLRLAAPPPR